MSNKLQVFFTFFCLLLISCSNIPNDYKIAALEKGTSYYSSAFAISEIIKPIDIEMSVISGSELGSYENCKMLWKGKADFAIAQNDTRATDFLKESMSITDSRIRTIMPLFPEILYIIHADTINPKDLKDLIVGRKIGLGPANSGTSIFFKKLLNHFGIDSTQYQTIHKKWSENLISQDIDVSVTVSGFNSPQVISMLKNQNCKIFSLSNIDLFKRGSSVEGFCLNYPSSRPYIIPENTFGSKPSQPVVTIAIDAVLLCQTSIDKNTVYEITREIYKQKNILAEMDPLLSAITDQYDRNILSFPLHEGTLMYLERNKPSFLERYAEIFSVIISILIALAGAGAALIKIHNTRKKNRVDVYYRKLIEIEKKYDDDTNYTDIEALNEIKELKKKGVQQLIDEKLSANESFNIFLNLSNTLINKIHHRTTSPGTAV